MKLILDNFNQNGLVHEPPSTMSDQLINMSTVVNEEKLKDVEYIRPLLDYKEPWSVEGDLFQYLKEDSLAKLRNGNCVLVFDASMEGFSPYELPLAISLHRSCIKHNVDPRKIYLLTANWKENDCHNNYIALNGNQYGINIVETTIIGNMVMPNKFESWEEHFELCQKHHSDKMFLQLSRRSRPYRVMANYMMLNSRASNYGLISQDKLTDEEINRLMYHYKKSPVGTDDITLREVKSLNEKKLPLIVDNTDFQINWASWRSPDLYNKTLFSVVLETSQYDFGGTALFPSEKIFKPIVHRQPFIIFGHRGINSFLRTMGLKTYEQWFDIPDVDYETDPVARYKRILFQVERIVDQLKKMSIQERVKWRFMNLEVLNYNYNTVVTGVLRRREALRMHKTIDSYFKGNFYNQLTPTFDL